jgi:hypothetical protein
VDAVSPDADDTGGTGRLAELRTSARGWHGVQLAVLGFIGLCGVLQSNGGSNGPRWLQILAGLLVLSALALACVATALVATAAWPVRDVLDDDAPASAGPAHGAADGEVHRTARRLRLGIGLTFIAVVFLAVGATSAWWPEESASAGNQVEVTTNEGFACGQLRQGDDGTIAVDRSGQLLVIAAGDVVRLRPVAACD